MTGSPWIVQYRGGWCALPPGAVPDPDAWNDPTLCGHVVTMRGGSKRGRPDCPDCLAQLGRTVPMGSADLAAANMRRLRRAAGLTQEEFGQRIGWSKVTVSAAERSVDGSRRRAFVLRDLDLVAGALGVSPAALITPPDLCRVCSGAPPSGMICQECGSEGAPFGRDGTEASEHEEGT